MIPHLLLKLEPYRTFSFFIHPGADQAQAQNLVYNSQQFFVQVSANYRYTLQSIGSFFTFKPELRVYLDRLPQHRYEELGVPGDGEGGERVVEVLRVGVGGVRDHEVAEHGDWKAEEGEAGAAGGGGAEQVFEDLGKYGH